MKLTSTHYFIILAVVVLAALFGWRYYQSVRPGQYDEFAQCIADSGATFYGAFWCPHCADQKALFGNSVKLLPYQECSLPSHQQTDECNSLGISTYPTWQFADGSRLEGVQSLQSLAEKTGCQL